MPGTDALSALIDETQEAGITTEQVLVVTEDPGLRRAIAAHLQQAGYEVAEAADGAAGVAQAVTLRPALVLLDVLLPRMPGLEVCERLRAEVATERTPIILMADEAGVEDRIRGLRLGADEYLTKPVDLRELAARVHRLIARTRSDLDASPLTGLPGNTTLEHQIAQRIGQRGRLAVVQFDLDRFKEYNDYYNYRRGDRVLQLVAQIVVEAARAAGDAETFVAHIGGDDFFVVTSPECADAIAYRVIEAFDATIPLCYDHEDRERGCIAAVNREGEAQTFPLAAMSVAIVTNEADDVQHPGQVAQILAELKAYAKRTPNSTVVRDRRQQHAAGSAPESPSPHQAEGSAHAEEDHAG